MGKEVGGRRVRAVLAVVERRLWLSALGRCWLRRSRRWQLRRLRLRWGSALSGEDVLRRIGLYLRARVGRPWVRLACWRSFEVAEVAVEVGVNEELVVRHVVWEKRHSLCRGS